MLRDRWSRSGGGAIAGLILHAAQTNEVRERERKDRRVEINLLLLYSLDKNGRTGRSTIDHQFLLFSLFVCRHIDRWLSSFESHSVLLLFFSFLLFRVSSSFSQCQQTTQLNISHEDPFLLLSIRPWWSSSDEKCRTINNSRAVTREREREKNEHYRSDELGSKETASQRQSETNFLRCTEKGREEQKRKYYIASCM